MKIFVIRLLFIFLLITGSVSPNYIVAQQKDTLTQTIPSNENVEDDEFNLFLMMFALAALSLMAGCLIVGLVVVLLFILLIGIMIAAGIISTSILIGYYKKSLKAGFKAFVLIGSSVSGAIMGLLGFALIVKLFELNISKQTILISGTLFGFAGGLLLGWVVYKIIKIFLKLAVEKIKKD